MKNARAFLFISLGFTLILTFLFGPHVKPVQAETRMLKVGLVAPFLGEWATAGTVMRQGVEVWANDINERGGIKAGGNTYTIQPMFYDDKGYVPAESLKAVTKAVLEDGVRILVTTSVTAVNLAIAPIVQKNDAVVFTWGAGFGLGPERHNIIAAATMWPQFHPCVLQYLAKRYPEVKKVASIYPDAAWAVDDQLWYELGAETLGFEIVFSKRFDPATVDWFPILTPVVAAKPHAIYVTASAAAIPTILETAKALGYKGKWYLDSWYLDRIEKKVSIDYVEGGIGAKAPPNNPAVVSDAAYRYWQRYSTLHPGVWPTSVASSVFAASLVPVGVELANSVDPMAIRKALLAANPIVHPYFGKSQWGGKEIYGADHFLMTPTYIGEVVKGEFKVVDVIPFYDWYSKNTDTIVKRMKAKGYIK